MAIVNITGSITPPGDVSNIDLGGGTLVGSLGFVSGDTSQTGQTDAIYTGFQFGSTCVVTVATTITISTTISDLGAPWAEDEDFAASAASIDGLNVLTATPSNPLVSGDAAVNAGLSNLIIRGHQGFAAVDTSPDAGVIEYTVTVPPGTAISDLRVLQMLYGDMPTPVTDNRLSAIPPSISFDDVACATPPVPGVAMPAPYRPGVICYALAGPLDCFGRPTDITTGLPVDITDGAALYTPAVGKRTVMSLGCHVKDITLEEVRSDEIVVNEFECDELRIPGEVRGWTGEWTKSAVMSPDFDELIGLRRNLYSAGTLVGSQPVEGYNSCACGAGCKRAAWWMLVWRQKLDPKSVAPRPIIGPGGSAEWEVELYPYLTATAGISRQKTTVQNRLGDQDDPTFTVRGDRNTAVDWSGIVVPDGVGGFLPLIPGPLALADGTAVNLGSELGSELDIFTEIPPPGASCDNVLPEWISLAP